MASRCIASRGHNTGNNRDFVHGVSSSGHKSLYHHKPLHEPWQFSTGLALMKPLAGACCASSTVELLLVGSSCQDCHHKLSDLSNHQLTCRPTCSSCSGLVHGHGLRAPLVPPRYNGAARYSRIISARKKGPLPMKGLWAIMLRTLEVQVLWKARQLHRAASGRQNGANVHRRSVVSTCCI